MVVMMWLWLKKEQNMAMLVKRKLPKLVVFRWFNVA